MPAVGSTFPLKLDPDKRHQSPLKRSASFHELSGRKVCVDSKSQPICGHLMPTWSPFLGPCYHVTTYCHHPLHHHVCYYASPPPWMLYPHAQTHHPHKHIDQTHHIPPHVDESQEPLSCPHPYAHAHAHAHAHAYAYPYPHPYPHPHHANVTDPHPHPHPHPDETDHSHEPHVIDPHTHTHPHAHPHPHPYPHPYPLHAHANDVDPHPHPHPYVLCQHCSNLLLLPFPLPYLDGPNPNLKLKCGQCRKISTFSSDQLHMTGIPASDVVTSSLISGPDALHGSDSGRPFSGQFTRIDNVRPRRSVDSSGVNVSKDYIEERHIKSDEVSRRRVKLYDLLHGNNPLDSSNNDKLQFNLSNNHKLQFNSSRSDKLQFDKSRGGKLHFDSSRSDKQQFHSSNSGELHFDKSRVGKIQSNSSKSGKLRTNSSNGVDLKCGSTKGAKLPYDSTNLIKKPQCDSTNGVKQQFDSTNGFESRTVSFGLKHQYESAIDGVKVNDTSSGIELHDTLNDVELCEPSSTMDDSKTNDLIFLKMNPDGVIRHSPNEIEDGVFPNKLIAIQDWVNAIATQGFETYPHEEEVMPNIACTSCTSPTRNFTGNAYSEDEGEREPQHMFSCRSTPSTTNHITKGYYYGKRRVFSSDAIHVKDSSSRRGEGEAKDVQRSVSSLLKKLKLKDYASEKRNFFVSNSKQRVIVNGEVLSKSSLKKAEERAGKLRPGSYWYDCKAGFWGVVGGPCLGILPPFIEELSYPMPQQCSNGTTQVYVNGRELHVKDLEILAKRGLPEKAGESYMLGFDGILIDESTGEELKQLGKLAPTVERRGKGFGMFSANDEMLKQKS